MTFLPIVTRELLVAARKRSTFWVRVIAALVALVIGTGCLMMFHVFGSTVFGGALFSILTWISFAAALSTGLFFTSDCLSEEKREGTLGFLFLTDLRGYDVALGKLLATSLRGSFAFVAIFPVLAITLLMGGVTGAQFWKTALAVLNALICSLAAGIVISALSRDSQKAFGGTFLLLLVLGAGGPIADSIMGELNHRGFQPVLSLSSPFYVFSIADAWGRNPFWLGLLVDLAVAGSFLGLASALVRYSWQEKPAKTTAPLTSWSYKWRYGTARRRVALRKKLLEVNPVLWLACRERWQSLGIWALAITGVVTVLAVLASNIPPEFWASWMFVGWFVSTGLYLWAASQSCRFFVESRRSGLLELVLSSPVDSTQIVQGQWRALWRMFGAPVLLLVGLQVAGACLSQQVTWGTMAGQMGGQIPQSLLVAAGAAKTALGTLADLLALAWFGLWMGLTSKNTSLATLKTILFVEVVPFFVIQFASAMVLGLLMMPLMAQGMASGQPPAFAVWLPLLMGAVSTALSVAKDAFFFILSRRKLYANLRELASRSLSLPAAAPAQRLPPLIPKPPLVAASP
jgi:hypothetical protein